MRFFSIIFIFLSCSTPPQNYSNLNDTKTSLAPCPSSPNCVSSTAIKKSKRIAPLLFDIASESAMVRLDSMIQTFPRVTLLSKTDTYLHYTFKTKLGGFVDDVEFLLDSSSNRIHFRSASRKGWSDAGANKRRMKRIVRKWKEGVDKG